MECARAGRVRVGCYGLLCVLFAVETGFVAVAALKACASSKWSPCAAWLVAFAHQGGGSQRIIVTAYENAVVCNRGEECEPWH
jgi:hypothetical protein